MTLASDKGINMWPIYVKQPEQLHSETDSRKGFAKVWGLGICLTARTDREYNIMKSVYLVPNSGAPVGAISASEPPFVSDGCYKEVA